MAQVLSQSEIDEILKAIELGEIAPEDFTVEEEKPNTIKPYNFRTANKFPKEQMKTLNFIHENLARLLSTYLASTIGGLCEVSVISIEEQTYHEYINSLPANVLLNILSIEPLHGLVLMEISSTVVFSIISRLFGGTGDVKLKDRIFTEIELVIIERVMNQIVPLINESWDKIIQVSTVLERIETNAQFAQIVSVNETIAIITMIVKIDEADGLINFCIPKVAIEPVVKRLNTKTLYSGSVNQKRDYVSNSELLKQRLNDTLVNLKVVLSDATLSISDIVNLQVGDVVQLDNKVNDKVIVYVEHIPKLYGILGVKENKYAIKVTDVLNGEESYDE